MSDDNTTTDDKKPDEDGKAGAGTGAAGDSGASGSDSGDKPRMYTPEEYEALQRRMQAADRTATEKSKKLEEIENANKDELTRTKDQLAKATAEIATLRESNKTTLLKAEFGLAGVQWHNPATAYATLLNEYPDAVHVDDDGKVVGMKSAVEKLAKEHAYLVKAAEEKKDDSSAATGPVKNGTRKGDTGADAMSEALRKRMPALARVSKKN